MLLEKEKKVISKEHKGKFTHMFISFMKYVVIDLTLLIFGTKDLSHVRQIPQADWLSPLDFILRQGLYRFPELVSNFWLSCFLLLNNGCYSCERTQRWGEFSILQKNKQLEWFGAFPCPNLQGIMLWKQKHPPLLVGCLKCKGESSAFTRSVRGLPTWCLII